MSRRIEDLDPRMQRRAQDFLARAWAAGLPVVITQTLRTRAEQQCLYAQGRTAPGPIVTNAGPGSSPHCCGLAFDVAFKIPGGVGWDEPRPGAWDELGTIGEALGLVWGGRWTHPQDRPHFELDEWRLASRAASLPESPPPAAPPGPGDVPQTPPGPPEA